VEQLGGRGSVLTRQKRDHILLDELLRQLEASPLEEQGQILRRIYRLVFPHAYAEETVLWPLIRRVLPDGHELTLQVEIEHQEINSLAVRLETLEHGSEERPQALARLVALLRQDVRDEEDTLLPSLQMRLGTRQLRRVGLAWEAVRSLSPTRPHQIVSRRPPGNLLAALPLAVIDRLRDGVDAMLDRESALLDIPLRSLGSGLAGASHAVERLPGMKLGEDPATRTAGSRRLGWGVAAATAVSAAVMMLAWASRRAARPGV
jgi:hypothetical protein